MHHRQILDMALRGLPSAKAAYISRIADHLSREPALEERAHLLYPVLAASVMGLEPVLEPDESARLITRFLVENAEGVARTLYSPDYLRDRATAMAPWAARLQAVLSVAILDKLQHGALVMEETKIWRFGHPGREDASFPYDDPDDEAES